MGQIEAILPDGVAWCVTAAFVLVGFAFFRGHTVGDALTIVRSMFMPRIWAVRARQDDGGS